MQECRFPSALTALGVVCFQSLWVCKTKQFEIHLSLHFLDLTVTCRQLSHDIWSPFLRPSFRPLPVSPLGCFAFRWHFSDIRDGNRASVAYLANFSPSLCFLMVFMAYFAISVTQLFIVKCVDFLLSFRSSVNKKSEQSGCTVFQTGNALWVELWRCRSSWTGVIIFPWLIFAHIHLQCGPNQDLITHGIFAQTFSFSNHLKLVLRDEWLIF